LEVRNREEGDGKGGKRIDASLPGPKLFRLTDGRSERVADLSEEENERSDSSNIGVGDYGGEEGRGKRYQLRCSSE